MKIPIAILNSVLPFLITGITGVYTSLYILFKKPRDKEKLSFAVCWLIIGLSYLMAAGRISAFEAGLLWLDKNIFYLLEVAIGLLAGPLIFYLAWILTRNNILSEALTFMAVIFGLLFVFFVFKEGVEGPKALISGSDYKPPDSASFFFLVPFSVALLLIIIKLIKTITGWIKRKSISEPKRFVAVSSLLLFLISAGIDNSGLEIGGRLNVVRIITMISALLASLTYH